MLKRFFIILFFLPAFSYSQKIQVVDAGSDLPIHDVLIYNPDLTKQVQTDRNGEAKLDLFSSGGEDTLIFQHPSYILKVLSLNEIRALDFKILLREDVINMDEVVVSASQWEQNSREIPNQILSVKSYDIAFSNPQTAADVLDKTGQVFVQKSQLGGGSPMIRGFAANSVLISVEGVRMNNAIFRSGNLQNIINVDPLILEGAEVLYGPGTVIYGSDALGGVMDFHFYHPELNDEEKFQVEGNAFARFSTANLEKTAHVDVNVFNHRFSSLTSFSFSDFDDLITGRNRTEEFPDFGKRPWYVKRVNGEDRIIENEDVNKQIGSAYSQWNLLQKFRYVVNPRLELTYTLNYSSTSDIPRYDRLIEERDGMPRSAEWFYGPQTWLFSVLKAQFKNSNRMYDQGKVSIGYQLFQESRNDRRFQDPNLRQRTEKVDAISLNADFDKSIGSKSSIFYGLEFVYNDVGSKANSRDIDTREISPASTRYPDGGSDYRSTALYVGWRHKTSEQLNLTAGLRYSHVYLKSVFEDTTFFDFPFDEVELRNGALTGSAGLTWNFRPNWQWSGLVSSGFRAPNVDDVGKVFDSEPGVVVVPNPDLKPEFSYNFETGLSATFGDRFFIRGVVFYSLLRDAMVRRPFTFNGQDYILYDGELSAVEALVNAGEAYVFGWSFTMRAKISEHWSLNGSITDTRGEDQIENIPLRHTTPLFGSAALVYRMNRFKGEFLVRFNGSRAFEDLPPSEQNKTHLYTSDGSLSWTTLNLYGSYSLSNRWQFTASLENLLNTHYRPYSSGISAAGLNFTLGVRAGF